MTPMDYSALGGLMAMIGAFNWMAGDRSFFGNPMEIRRGSFWVASRWLGVGLIAPLVLGQLYHNDSTLFDGTPLTVFGGAALLLGSARKVVKKKTKAVVGAEKPTSLGADW